MIDISERIRSNDYNDKITTAEAAAALIHPNDQVGMTFAAMIVLAGLALAGTLLIRKPHVMTESNQVGIGTIKS